MSPLSQLGGEADLGFVLQAFFTGYLLKLVFGSRVDFSNF